MSNVVTLTPDAVPAIRYHGKPVVTSAMLARLYGATESQLRKNYSRNRARFVEGKHYIKVEGSELKDLKNRVSLRGSVGIGANARSVTLWTQRGAARHAKMLETDKAWDVFEALEDNYFASPLQRLEEAVTALKAQDQLGSHAGRELNRHKHLRPEMQKEVDRRYREVQMTLPHIAIIHDDEG